MNAMQSPGPGSDIATEANWTLPVYSQLDLTPATGDGVWLETSDGRRVLDFYGGHAVASLGYGHPRLVAALAGQARSLTFQSNLMPLAVRARACEALVRFAPAGLTRAFLVNSGAEANENALRLALAATGRDRVVALEGAFHGRTAAAAAVTWGSERWYGFPRRPFDATFVAPGDLAALEAAVGPDVAAVIVEPVQGVAGAVDLPRAFLQAARDAARRHGALLIFDEVQCGMGRSGQPFAADHYGIAPDLLTTAKGLAGGFPAGALLATDELSRDLKPGDLGTTFGGGPLACAAIETVIAVIREDGLLARVRELSALLRSSCRRGPVQGVQGLGFLLGLICARPAKAVQAELLARGILAGTSADPRVLRLLPPLTLEAAHVELLADTLAGLSP